MLGNKCKSVSRPIIYISPNHHKLKQGMVVSEQISEVEQRLHHHSAVVAGFFESKQTGSHQGEPMGSEEALGNVPSNGGLDTGTPTSEPPSHPGPPRPFTYIQGGQATQPFTIDPVAPANDAFTRNDITPQAMAVTKQATRLHSDNFIQTLSE